MHVIAAVLLLACLAFAGVLWHRRHGREETAELDEAIGRVREGLGELQWRRAVVPLAIVAALGLIATLARNPSRWALLLVALGVLAAAVVAFVVSERRRRAD
jgi:di/tricarboxylate transporter